MRKRRNIARLFITTLALVSLMSDVALMPIRPARAQTVGGGWAFTDSLSAGRFGHTATLLPNGKVLVVGGGGFPCSGNYCYSTVNGSAELYDPATGTWSYTGSLIQRRISHSATLLQNGQVLVAGGYNYGHDIGYFADINSVELYDPAAGTWRPTASLITTYLAHRATLLQNGKVLVVGIPRGSQANSAELYDLATGTWSSTGAPTVFGLLTLLPSGKVLVTGTRDSRARSEVYDPTTEIWSSTDNPNVTGSVSTATLLQNGKVLITGDTGTSGPIPKAELYDPTTGFWSITGSPVHCSTWATLLSDGRVLVTGTFDPNSFLPFDEAELYDSETGTWSLTSHLNTPRLGHTATLLANGRVLVAGGNNGDFDWITVFNSAELYTPPATPIPNQIDDTEFFVRQHYRDFLNREPDADGLAFWTNEITLCGADQSCIDAKRINVSAAFFLSTEFQQTGYLVYRIYKASYGNLPGAPVPIRRSDFTPDTQQIGQGVIVNQAGWEQVLENNKNTFASAFVTRSRFTTAFPQVMTAEQFVDALNANSGGVLSQGERDQLLSELASGAKTRAQVLRSVAENSTLAQQEFNKAFVLMQYFGYLRRNPNDAPDMHFVGYDFWLDKLNRFNGNFVQAEMVKAFISSAEYRQRFAQP